MYLKVVDLIVHLPHLLNQLILPERDVIHAVAWRRHEVRFVKMFWLVRVTLEWQSLRQVNEKNTLKIIIPSLLVLLACRLRVRMSVALTALQASARRRSAKLRSRSDRL